MKKILICDDDQDLLEITSLIFENENYDVKTLMNLSGILDTVNDFKPDIILMDLYMPDMNGDEAIRLLRTAKEHPDIPVILFSAASDVEKVVDELKVPFIAKPFDIAELKNKVKSNIV